YYSAWYYSAVHVLLTIPEMQSETAVAEKLSLPLPEVRRILSTLEALGLVTRSKSRWMPTKNNVQLSTDSGMAAIHHVNWRTKITDRIQFRNPEDLHYTGLHTLSRADFKKIKAQLLEALVAVDKTVRPSKEEDLCSLMIDWTII